MSVVPFSIANLKDLDQGKGVAIFEHLLKLAAIDCSERPAESKVRKVVLEVQMSPVCESQGDCTSVEARIVARSTVPAQQSRLYSLGLRRNGVLCFNPDSVDNINQASLFNGDDE